MLENTGCGNEICHGNMICFDKGVNESCDCVSGSYIISMRGEHRHHHSMPRRSPFSPPTGGTRLSNHPKTILNRTYEARRDPLERALGRDDVAFRKAKSRRLGAFRSSKEWERLSKTDRERAEQEIIGSLIAMRDAKKREHEMEWRRKVEAGEDEDQDESPDNEKPGSVGNAEAETMGSVGLGDDDDEWMSENSETEVVGDENEVMKGFAHSVSQIKRLWGEGYWKQVAEVESKAKAKEAEYNEFLERRQ